MRGLDDLIPGGPHAANAGRVMTMPTAGGTPLTLATPVSAGHLALDAHDVYFTQQVERIGFVGSKSVYVTDLVDGTVERITRE